MVMIYSDHLQNKRTYKVQCNKFTDISNHFTTVIFVTMKNNLLSMVTTFQSMRFPDFYSRADKDSSIYCLTLWSTVIASR